MKPSLRCVLMLIALSFVLPFVSETHPTSAANRRTVINAANATRLQELHLLGKGEVGDLTWSPDGDWLVVSTSRGIWLYNPDAPDDAPILLDSRVTLKTVFSADGTRLASFNRFSSVSIWDFKAMKRLSMIPIPKQNPAKWAGQVYGVWFTPANEPIITAGKEYREGFHTWNAQTGATLVDETDFTTPIREADGSPDGTTLALVVGGDNPADAAVRFWNLNTGKQVDKLYAGFNSMTNSVAFNADGSKIATGHGNVPSDYMDSSADNVVVVWDSKTRQQLSVLTGHTRWVTEVKFSPDGQLIASASGDDTVRIWDANTGEMRLDLQGMNGVVNDLAFSPSGDKLAVSSGGGQITFWDIPSGAQHNLIDGFGGDSSPYVGPGGPGGSCCMVWSQDSKIVAVGQYNGLVPIWDADTGETLHLLHAHDGVVTGVGLNAATRTLVTSGWDNIIRLWSLKSGEPMSSLKGRDNDPAYENDFYRSVQVSPDGKYMTFYNGYSNGTIELRTVQDFDKVQSYFFYGDVAAQLPTFSPDSSMLALNQKDGIVSLMDVNTGADIRSFVHTDEGKCGDFCSNGLVSLVFDTTGSRLGALSRHGDVLIWDIQTGATLTNLSLGTHSSDDFSETYLTFNPTLTQVAGFNSRTEAGTLPDGRELYEGHVWDVETGQVIATFDAPPGGAQFSPDGLMIAVGERFSGVMLFKAKSGQQVAWLHMPDDGSNIDQLRDYSFSPDGTLIALQGPDDAVTLYGIP